MQIEIVWPEHRLMSCEEIEQQFVEALARGEFYQPEHMMARAPQEMAEALHAIGKIHLQVNRLL